MIIYYMSSVISWKAIRFQQHNILVIFIQLQGATYEITENNWLTNVASRF